MTDKKSLTAVWTRSYPQGLDWNMPLPAGMSMVDMFDQSVAKYADKPCLEFMGKRLSYREVGELVDRTAKGFQDMGVVKGSKVGLSLPNCPFYVISYFAALKAGATVVNFNPLYAENQMKHQINDSGADIMVTLNLKQTYSKIENMLGQTCLKTIVACDLGDMLPAVKGTAFKAISRVQGIFTKKEGVARVKKSARPHIVPFTRLMKAKGKPAPVALDAANDVAVLQYTGGTTGVPKAAMLTHGNLVANVTQVSTWFQGAKKGEEKMMAVLPFFHVFAMTTEMNLGIEMGAEIIMQPKFEIKKLLKAIDTQKPTVFAGVPTLYHAISEAVDKAPAGKKPDITSLRYCISGGAPLPDPTRVRFEGLTGCTLVEGYGLSETSPVATANPIKGVRKAGSIGLPMPGTEVRITDLEFPDKSQPINVSGEICLRGPQVMKGYWNRPDETDKVMTKDGFLRTGDVGYVDEDGYVFIVDRIKDMIIAGGYNIYPRKVEEAILKHPSVSEVIVAGVDDEYRGETVKAFIVLKEGAKLEKDELKAFLKADLSAIEMPKLIDFRDSLPKTMIGKPSRKDLLEEEAAKKAAASTAKPAAPKR